MSAMPGWGSAPGPALPRADEPAAESPRRGRAAVVRCGRGESPGARWCASGGADHGAGRADDPSWPGGSGRVAGCRPDQAAAAAAWRRSPAGRKKDPAIVTALTELVEPVTAGD